MDTDIVNIETVSLWYSLYVLNTYATFVAQFMKKLINTKAGLKTSVAYEKKECIRIIFLEVWFQSQQKEHGFF